MLFRSGLRVGLIVPRFKHSAVARNRLKRRLRELTRLRLLPVPFKMDVVLRIRPEAYEASFDRLTTDIVQAVEQLRQWHESQSMLDEIADMKPDDSG